MQNLAHVSELSASYQQAVALKLLTNKICCKRQKLFFLFGLKLGEKKIKIFLSLGGGGVGGQHSSPLIFFHKKLRKVGLFLRTFFGIKIFEAIPKLLTSQVFGKNLILLESYQNVVGELLLSFELISKVFQAPINYSFTCMFIRSKKYTSES